jgi:hypothetical protein
MNAREFSKLLQRDLHCLECGRDDDTLVVHHRINRGMGGAGTYSKRNQPSNLMVVCSDFNQRMEADPDAQQLAKSRNWKLESWQSPEDLPVWDAPRQRWMFLDNSYQSFEAYEYGEDV